MGFNCPEMAGTVLKFYPAVRNYKTRPNILELVQVLSKMQFNLYWKLVCSFLASIARLMVAHTDSSFKISSVAVDFFLLHLTVTLHQTANGYCQLVFQLVSTGVFFKTSRKYWCPW